MSAVKERCDAIMARVRARECPRLIRRVAMQMESYSLYWKYCPAHRRDKYSNDTAASICSKCKEIEVYDLETAFAIVSLLINNIEVRHLGYIKPIVRLISERTHGTGANDIRVYLSKFGLEDLLNEVDSIQEVGQLSNVSSSASTLEITFSKRPHIRT